MNEITRTRIIRPSTRLEKSKSYKVDTKSVSNGDILVVNIEHESKPFHISYRFKGSDVAYKDSISFKVKEYGHSIEIIWSGATPIDNVKSNSMLQENRVNLLRNNKMLKMATKHQSEDFKKSFDPISNEQTTVLILGTMPGDKSFEIAEYYGNSRNRFWNIIAKITGNNIPLTYEEKKSLLIKTKIGIWDVVHKANRLGSLDSAIKDEEPNDLNSFVAKHKYLKIIAFNGVKSKALFDKYFERKNGIKYIILPSSSPANTSAGFEYLCKQWSQLLEK